MYTSTWVWKPLECVLYKSSFMWLFHAHPVGVISGDSDNFWVHSYVPFKFLTKWPDCMWYSERIIKSRNVTNYRATGWWLSDQVRGLVFALGATSHFRLTCNVLPGAAKEILPQTIWTVAVRLYIKEQWRPWSQWERSFLLYSRRIAGLCENSQLEEAKIRHGELEAILKQYYIPYPAHDMKTPTKALYELAGLKFLFI